MEPYEVDGALAAISQAPPTPVRDLTVRELRTAIQEGVYRGALKTLAVLAALTIGIWAATVIIRVLQ